MNDFSKFREKFRVEELKLFETKHWVWSLRPVQVTLGSGVLSLKRPCSFFSQLEEAEFCDLQVIMRHRTKHREPSTTMLRIVDAYDGAYIFMLYLGTVEV